MWYALRRFEEALFLVPFLIYTSIFRIPHSTRCNKCGKLLLSSDDCGAGLCWNCRHKLVASDSEESYYYEKEEPGVIRSKWHVYNTVVEMVSEGKVLDVGCGDGFILSSIEPQNRELYGFDMSRALIECTQSHAPYANLCLADARAFPFGSNTFDYLTCTDVLEHIEGNDVVGECYRVLKPGGTALFTVPNKSGVDGRLPEHIRFFSFRSFKVLLEKAGFTVISSRKCGLYFPMITHLVRSISYFVTKRYLPLSVPLNISVPECLATTFLIECRKPTLHI